MNSQSIAQIGVRMKEILQFEISSFLGLMMMVVGLLEEMTFDKVIRLQLNQFHWIEISKSLI